MTNTRTIDSHTHILTEEAMLGVARPAVLAAAGTPDAVRRMFIDCQWALDYLGR